MTETSTPRRSVFQIVRWTVTLLALGMVVYLLVDNWASIWEGMLQIGGGRFALLVLLTLISRLLLSLRWYLILRTAAGEVHYPAVLRVTFAGFFANNFMPSTIGGDVFRLTGAVLEGFGTAASAASLLMDRIVGMLGMALALPAGLVRLFAYQGDLEIKFGQGSAALAGGLIHRLGAGGRKAISWLKQAWEKLWKTLGLWARRPQGLIPSLFVTLIHQISLYGFIWLILDAFGFQLSWWLIAGLWSLVYFVTLLPISISGLGVQEVIILFAFSNLGGVSEAAALTLALLFRTVILLVSLPGALAVPALMPEARKRKEL